MPRRDLAAFTEELAGAIAALEVQIRAMLTAMVRSGLDPQLVWAALDESRRPVISSAEANASYTRFMEHFRELVAALDRDRGGAPPSS